MNAPKRSIQPRRAWRAIRTLIADPERTEQVFEVLDALAGDAQQRGLARLRTTAAGQRLLAEQSALIDALRDRAALRAMPDGSLGRRYLAFMERENLSADGLVDASRARADTEQDPQQRWYNARLRDAHDLWHVVTGYGRDGFGEVCLLAFTFAQTRNRGIATIAFFGARQASREIGMRAWRAAIEGFRHGRRAAWLPEQDWLALLPLRLDAVRQALGVEAPRHYALPIEATTSADDEQRAALSA